MTLEELKTEANKLGYNVIKKQQHIKMQPCKCGSKNLGIGIDNGMYCIECNKCGFSSKPAKTQKQSRSNWNEEIIKRE